MTQFNTINTTLLTDDEKEYLDELKDYQEIAKLRIEFFSKNECEASLINDFSLAKWTHELRQIDSEIKSLGLFANARANRILELCHTGK